MSETLAYRIIITGTVSLKTGLHVGTGEYVGATGTDSPVIKDMIGRPFIPGSSFKGVLRTTIEQLLYPFAPSSISACLITSDESAECLSVNKRLQKELEDEKDKLKKQKVPDLDARITSWILAHSCNVCEVLGSPFLASKVFIKDLLVKEWFEHYEVRDGVAIDRDTETALDGRKYDYETVPAGVEFGCKIVVERASDIDLGILFLGLEEFRRGRAMLGGRSSRGLGWIEFQPEEIEIIGGSPSDLLNYLKTGRGLIYKDEIVSDTEDSTQADMEQRESAKHPDSIQSPENALFSKVVQAVQFVETQGHRRDVANIGNALSSEYGVNKNDYFKLGFSKLSDLLAKAVEKGLLQEEADGQYRIAGDSQETKPLLDEAKKEKEEQKPQIAGKLDDFIKPKIEKLIEELEKGEGDDAQATS